LVQGVLIVAAVRFRHRPGAPDPKPVHGNTALEIAWTLAPAVILALVAIPTIQTIFRSQSGFPKDALKVEVIGHQWWWEFRYPELGVVTASELHVPLRRSVVVDIQSADVIHSVWFPAIGGKRDAIPGHTNHIWFTRHLAYSITDAPARKPGSVMPAIAGMGRTAEQIPAVGAYIRSLR